MPDRKHRAWHWLKAYCRMIRWSQAFFPILCAFALLSCTTKPKPAASGSGSANAAQNTGVVKKRILFFGNSITAGYRLQPNEAFSALIQQKIDSLGLPYQTVNAGLSGETSAAGSNRIEWLLKQPVDIFVLELGANDGLRGIPVEETYTNLTAIIDKVQGKYPEAQIILAGMKVPPNMGEDYALAFESNFTRIAEEQNITLIPFLLDGVAGNPDLNLPDRIHPNPTGHRILSNTLWSYLEPLLTSG